LKRNTRRTNIQSLVRELTVFECWFQKKFDWSLEILQGELLQRQLFELWSKRKFRSLIEKTCSIIYCWRFIEFLQHGFRFVYDTNGKISQNMCCQWSSCESFSVWFYFMKKSNKMLKIILALVLAILLIVCVVKFEIALFKFLSVVLLIALACVLVYM